MILEERHDRMVCDLLVCGLGGIDRLVCQGREKDQAGPAM